MPLEGTLDTSFGINGVATYSLLNSDALLTSTVIDYSNNIISAIKYNNKGYSLIKYDISGNFIADFVVNGGNLANFSSPTDNSWVNSITVNQNNEIIIAGYMGYSVGNYYALAKYDQSGNLVPSFGNNNNGVILSNFSTSTSGINSVVIDHNNNIVAGGFDGFSYALAKFDQSGNLLTNFGYNGAVLSDFSGNETQANSVAIDQNDNIIIACSNKIGSHRCYALAKYDPSGHLVTSFGTLGKVVGDFSGNVINSYVKSVEIDQNNNIVIAGYYGNDYALAKYDPSGHLVTSFGTNGVIVTDFSGNNSTSTASSVAIDQSNNIIVAGTNNFTNYALAKYDPSGNLITNFGTLGTVLTNFSGNYNIVQSVKIDQNNNIVAGGVANAKYSLVKYYNTNSNPVLDSNIPISNVCFVKGTPIMTDQGIIPIEKINPEKHTIRNKSIVGITKTVYASDKYLICFEKNSLGKNIPSQKTITSENHKIFYGGAMNKAVSFVGNVKNVNKIDYKGEILYNVLLESCDKMVVNNMICETLDPASDMAKLYKNCQTLSIDDQNKLIKWYNNAFRKQNNIIGK